MTHEEGRRSLAQKVADETKDAQWWLERRRDAMTEWACDWLGMILAIVIAWGITWATDTLRQRRGTR